MKGVTFGGFHSFNEWGLILSEKEIKAPKAKTTKIQIEGSDGDLDYTDFFGSVKFENRQLSFKFYATNISQGSFLLLFSTVQNALHGKKMRVILDDDPLNFYYGRVTINEWKSNKRIGKIVIDVDAEPWKYKSARSSLLTNLAGKNLINLDNAIISPIGTWGKTTTGYSFDRGAAVGGSYAFFKVPLAEGKTYTFSSSTNSSEAVFLYVYSDKIYGKNIATGFDKITFTPKKSGLYYISLIVNSTTTYAQFNNIMLEEGSVITTYEAFEGTEKTISTFVSNSRMPTVPDIYSMDDVTITNGEETFFVRAGETLHKEEFELKEGSNQFNITGTGIVVFDYQEGEL